MKIVRMFSNKSWRIVERSRNDIVGMNSNYEIIVTPMEKNMTMTTNVNVMLIKVMTKMLLNMMMTKMIMTNIILYYL